MFQLKEIQNYNQTLKYRALRVNRGDKQNVYSAFKNIISKHISECFIANKVICYQLASLHSSFQLQQTTYENTK